MIGKPLEIDRKRAIVVGVMPAHFDFPAADTRVWIPLTFISQWPAFLTARQADAFNAVARLRAGVTPQQAQQEMAYLNARLNKQYPQFEAGKSVNVVPLTAELVGPRIRASLWMLFGAVLFVLLIACTNVASLVLARQRSREKENAVRWLWAPAARVLSGGNWWRALLSPFSPLCPVWLLPPQLSPLCAHLGRRASEALRTFTWIPRFLRSARFCPLSQACPLRPGAGVAQRPP